MKWTDQRTQYTSWDEKGSYRPGDLAKVDWGEEYYSLSHPVRIVSNDGRNLLDYDTGRVIATLTDGYKFFWAHDHVHVCEADWDTKSYPNQWPKKPLGE